jgi:hypothetical protein
MSESEDGKSPVRAEGRVAWGASALGVATVIDSLNEGYTQLSGTFTVDQKRIADSVVVPNLQTLERIAKNEEEQTKLMRQQREDALEDARRQKKRFYISTVIALVALIVAVVAVIVSILR